MEVITKPSGSSLKVDFKTTRKVKRLERFKSAYLRNAESTLLSCQQLAVLLYYSWSYEGKSLLLSLSHSCQMTLVFTSASKCVKSCLHSKTGVFHVRLIEHYKLNIRAHCKCLSALIANIKPNSLPFLFFAQLLKTQVEKRRRERMNRSLESLRALLLQGSQHQVSTSAPCVPLTATASVPQNSQM